MSYTREELITIGERFDADSLLEWSGRVMQAARQDLNRLKGRGITDQVLREIETARAETKTRNYALGREGRQPTAAAVARLEAIQAAAEWREEVRNLAKAVFDSDPDGYAAFRPGMKTSRSLPKLISDLRQLLAAARDRSAALRGVGVDDAFVARGEAALSKLEEVERRLTEDLGQTAPAALDLCHAMGVLYTRVRFLSRIARVEFAREAGKRERYSYAPIRERAELAAASR